MKQLCLALFGIALLTTAASAQEWTRFRGPNGTGISEAKGVPVKWTESDFLWRTPIPGQSDSQPVIWGDKLFVLSGQNGGAEKMIVCLDKNSGKQLWIKKYEMSNYRKNRNPTFAATTPTVDKDRVYATFCDMKQYLVKAWDHSGKELWSVNLGSYSAQHGLGASPILYEGRLIVCNDQNDKGKGSSIVALDAKTGKMVWKTPRKLNGNAPYTTPCIFKRGRYVELLTISRAHGIAGLDPRTGKPIWESGGSVFDKRSVASPVVAGGLVFGSCGSGAYSSNYLVAYKLGGRGSVGKSHQAYKLDRSTPYVPTPLVVGDRIFLFEDKNGIVTCAQASTGRVVWSERVHSSGFYGSPVLIDGNVYCNSKSGETVVFKASDSYELLATNPLGEGCHTTPCVDGNRLYIKTASHVVCIGGKK